MAGSFSEKIKPLLYVCRVLNVLQFNFDGVSKWTNYALLFTSVLLQIFHLASVIHGLLLIRNLELHESLYLVISITNLITKMFCYVKQRKLIKGLIKEIDELEEKEHNENETYKKRVYKYLFVVVVQQLSISILNVYICIVILNSSTFDFWTFSTSFFIGMYEYLLISEIMNHLRLRFASINNKLTVKINSPDLNKVFPKDALSSKLSKLERQEKEDAMRIIQKLSMTHYVLVKISESANLIFSIPTLFTLTADFVTITLTIYSIISIQKAFNKNDMESTVLFFIAEIYWFVFNLSHIILIIRTWTATANEANKTSTYIHDIWNKYAIKDEADIKIHHLQLVSVQLLNTRLNFTAYGFFPLDWSLLHMIVGAVTTYVVVLIQFES